MDDRPSELRAPARLPSRPALAPAARSRRSRFIWPAIGLVALATIAWIVFHPQSQTARTGRFALTGPIPVVAATVETGDMPVTINGLGTVTPLANVTVRTQISGQLIEIGFTEGQEVAKGDFLAQIDPRPYQATLDNMLGQQARDQAQLENARRDLARYSKLVTENSIAQQLRDTTDALVRQLVGTVASDQAQIDMARLNVAYCHIVAPVSGRVGLRQVDAGNYVQVSDANGIVVITQLKPISVIFSLPEDNLTAIIPRLHAGATLQVTALDRGGKIKLDTGTLATFDNQIDTSTGTFRLRAQFDNSAESLFPNQFVNVQLLVDTMQGAAVMPTAAVQRGAPGTFVYLIKPDGTVAVQKIALGPSTAERVAVTDGLRPGDRVVVDGADKLRDGAKVSTPDTAASAGAKASTPGAAASDGAKPSTPGAAASDASTASPQSQDRQPAGTKGQRLRGNQ
jgi:membrane fusion protein, multidrug efflux system